MSAGCTGWRPDTPTLVSSRRHSLCPEASGRRTGAARAPQQGGADHQPRPRPRPQGPQRGGTGRRRKRRGNLGEGTPSAPPSLEAVPGDSVFPLPSRVHPVWEGAGREGAAGRAAAPGRAAAAAARLMPQECAEVCASFQKWIPFLAGAEQRIYHPVAAVHLPCSFVTAYEGKLRVGNSPLLSSRLRRGSSHLEKASLPRQTPRIGSYSNRGASSALSYCRCFCPSFAAAATCCSFHKVPPELHRFPSSLYPGPTAAAAGTAGVTAGGAAHHRSRHPQPPLKVCARRSGDPLPSPRPTPRCLSVRTQPFLMRFRLG